MGDSFAKVNPGDPMDIAAAAWNSMLDVVRPDTSIGGEGLGGLARQATIIKVKNTSGATIARNQVLGLDVPVFTSATDVNVFLRAVVLKGVAVATATHKQRYCVTLDPAKNGEFCRAYIAGVCPVKVDILNTTHKFAVIKDATPGNMESSYFGHARILWQESGTGVKWAIIRLGETAPSVFRGSVTTAIPTGTIASPSTSGRVTLYHDTTAADTGVVVNNSHTLASSVATGKFVHLTMIDDNLWLTGADC